MKKIVSFVTNKWFLQVLGLICIALLIWFVGPLIAIADTHFLASDFARLLAIIIVIALWGANIARKQWQTKKKNQQLMDNLSSNQQVELREEQATAEEQGVIGERFDEALEVLNSHGKKNKYALYELPWYIIIGPPGSGKTTALVNSGLHFPLADKMGSETVQGIGGTRHCDWWFADEAVMIDTAGRFTTQDSYESVDKAAWQKFMELLKLNRPQQPINGAIIAMSMADLMQQSDEERRQCAKTIRRRIEELQENLGINFPIYFTFTKCDLIPGFSEFFGGYDKEARGQVWGETFGINADGQCDLTIEQYPEHFQQLSMRLQQQVLERLHHEHDPDKRGLILGFPSQFAGLGDIVSVFLNETFSSSRYSQPVLLRGVYYTSGTQVGSPIDRLLGNLVRSFGFGRTTMVGGSGKGKSFFIRDLLTRVIIGEAGVAGLDQGLLRKRQWIQRISATAALVVVGLAGSAWGWSYLNNEDRIEESSVQLAEVQSLQVAGPLGQADFRAVLPGLNSLNQMPAIYASAGVDHSFGLYQGDKVQQGSAAAYRKWLESQFLPVLVARIEELIIANDPRDTSALYELLRVYLMYGGVRDYDAELLKSWAMLDWQADNELTDDELQQLESHLDILLLEGFSPVVMNDKIITDARKNLSRDPLEKQVYQAVKRELQQNRQHDLVMDDVLGTYGFDIFRSKMGQDLRQFVIPGFFTKKGFYELFLPNSVEISKRYLENNWVMGERYQQANVDPAALQRKVLDLYYADYIKNWDGLLDDLAVKRPTDARDSVRQVSISAGIDSPVRYLLETVKEQTTLTQYLVEGQGEGSEELARSVASLNQKAAVQQQRVSKLLRNAKKAGLLDQLGGNLGERVERHYAPYHKLLERRGNSTLFDRLSDDLANLGLYMDSVANSSFSSTGALDAAQNRLARGGQDPIGKVNSYQHSLPPIMQGWVGDLGTQNWQMMLKGTLDELNQLWQTQVYQECKAFVAGRFPLNPKAASESTLEDFSRFFAPQGTLDVFYQSYLKDFVDTKGRKWVERKVDGQSIGLSRNTLAQLQRASKIQELFFRNGQLSVPFVMRPLSLDASVSKFDMTLGEQHITYRHGPRRPMNLNWPTQSTDSVSLTLEGPQGMLSSRSEIGPWAWFRVLNSARVNKTNNPAIHHVTFDEQGYKAMFELRALSAVNPFGEDLLSGFYCPESL
ncbi:type VI secretion system membrane subunit TssM [Aliamphritea ceti]|uniref:type VI secretion system membrane subunit TssM n=1 Tax=Aliamphritea ceti TaxID=1524258 RepID=UPI0021C36497|nr:type VI secretion system membrane subunit TssM [Aliamphritea ceti]